MKGIYKITNNITGMMYIGATMNASKRFEHHKSVMKTHKHKNKALREDVINYGLNNFSFEMIQEFDKISLEDLRRREALEIAKYDFDDLYNVVKDTFGGGAEVHCKETYLLDLGGNILKTFNSTIECFKYLGYKNPDYTWLNTETKRKGIYRIVTKEFYDNNFKEIKSWTTESTFEYNNRIKRLKALKKIVYVTDTLEGTTKEYATVSDAARSLNVTCEGIRVAIKEDRLLQKRYSFRKLNSNEINKLTTND